MPTVSSTRRRVILYHPGNLREEHPAGLWIHRYEAHGRGLAPGVMELNALLGSADDRGDLDNPCSPELSIDGQRPPNRSDNDV